MKNLDLISRVASAFLSRSGFDARMDEVLAQVGQQLGVSRAYVFLDDADGQTTSNTHEWCAPGVGAMKAELQRLPYESIPSWRRLLAEDGFIQSDRVAELPADLRAVLEPQGIRALVVHPLRVGDRVAGFVGFDECTRERRWEETELALLRTIAGLTSNAYERELDQLRLAVSEENFRRFFDTVDDVIVIGDLQGRLLHANAAATRKLGFSPEELRGMPIAEMHPADKRAEAERILSAMLRGERDHCPLELGRKDGSVLPVDTRVWLGTWNGQSCIFGISKDLSAEQEALQRFTRLFEANPALMAISDGETRAFLDVNDSFLERLGYPREEVLGHTGNELRLFVQPFQQRFIASELIRAGTVRNVELEVRRKDGEILQGLFSGALLESQGKRYLLTVMVDITEQTQLRARLATESQRLRNVIDGTGLGTWEWNIQTGETTFNERWAGLLGYRLAELAPVSIETWLKLAHPDDLLESDRRLQAHFSGERDHYEFEGRMRHKDGHWVWVLDRGKVVEWDAMGRPVRMFGTHADITEQKALQEEVRELSIRDELTGLYNRRYVFGRLDELAAEYLRKRRPFCVSIFDLDHFKRVNDTHGHLAGDAVLRQLGALLRAAIRPYDLVGRFGGEEFVLISVNAGREEAVAMVERILGTVRARPFEHEGIAIPMTCSAGVAASGEIGPERFSPAALVDLADRRLYQAKEGGRDRLVSGGVARALGAVS